MRSAGRVFLMAAMFLPCLDSRLVERASQGNSEAFNQLAQACHAPLVQYCLSCLRDYDLADEAAQLTLIQLHRKLQTLKEPQVFPAWVQRIAHNQCMDLLGQEIRALVSDSYHRPGQYTTAWDGRNDRGEAVASGVYFYQLELITSPQISEFGFQMSYAL